VLWVSVFYYWPFLSFKHAGEFTHNSYLWLKRQLFLPFDSSSYNLDVVALFWNYKSFN
jgi:hypothetical protein